MSWYNFQRIGAKTRLLPGDAAHWRLPLDEAVIER
jgi:hypothetical protein